MNSRLVSILSRAGLLEQDGEAFQLFPAQGAGSVKNRGGKPRAKPEDRDIAPVAGKGELRLRGGGIALHPGVQQLETFSEAFRRIGIMVARHHRDIARVAQLFQPFSPRLEFRR